jgi:CRISPR-associated endonuclease/helicase Cas3
LGPIRVRNEAVAGVYIDLRVLEATRRLIGAQPTRTIPADNRLLVEQATHPDALDAIARELGEDWLRFAIEFEGALAAKSSVANLHAIAFDQPFDALRFPDDEGRIGSRLGAADRVMTFDPAPQGPFGQPVTQLAIRHHLLPRGLAADAQPEEVEPLSAGQGFAFTLGTVRFRYSRVGLERLEKEPEGRREHAT